MATVEIPFLLGAAFKNQTVRGTATTMPTIGSGSGGTGAINNTTDGAVAGDPDSGAGGSGITLGLSKAITEKAPQAGSFSRDFGNFVAREVASFQMVLPLKGNGSTAGSPPVAANMTPDLGIIALLRAAGFVGGANAATWRYAPTATLLATAAIYNGNTAAANGLRAIIRDVESTGLTLDFTPGEIGKATFDLAGVVDSIDETGTWTATPFAYGNQATLSAPPVRSAAFTWGPGTPDTRAVGFSQLSIAIDNQAEDVKSSNSASGVIKRQTNRVITCSAIIDAAAAEILFETNQLAVSAIGSATQLTFQIGTTASNGSIVNAYRIVVPSPELVTLEKVDPLGASEAWSCEWIARSSTANTELFLDFL
jgi:hypothetical protein